MINKLYCRTDLSDKEVGFLDLSSVGVKKNRLCVRCRGEANYLIVRYPVFSAAVAISLAAGRQTSTDMAQISIGTAVAARDLLSVERFLFDLSSEGIIVAGDSYNTV